VSDDEDADELRVTGPAQRQLGRLPEGTVAAIIEFILSVLVENPHRVAGRLQRKLTGSSRPVVAPIGSCTRSMTTNMP